MAPKTLRFGIVGVGYWGPNYARILNEIEGVHLVWCCDRDRNALVKMKKRYPNVATTTNLNDVLENYSVDCVVVAVPAKQHFEIARRSLLAKKHVLIEKPMTTEAIHAKQLIKLSRKFKKIVSVDHTFMFNPGILKLKSMIKKGRLGKIYYLYGLYNALGPIRKEVSAMWDISPHFIYTANFLLGQKPIAVSVTGRSFLQPGVEDVVFLNFEYSDGVIFNLHSSWLDPAKIRQLVVVGSRKMAIFDDISPEGKLKIYDKSVFLTGDPNFANLSVILRSGGTLIPQLKNTEPLKGVVLDFVKAVRTGRRPVVSVEEGAEVVQILSAAQKSLRLKGKTIQIR